jgi:hypothetical protein
MQFKLVTEIYGLRTAAGCQAGQGTRQFSGDPRALFDPHCFDLYPDEGE